MINAYINNYYQHIKHITINKCFIGFQKRKLLIVIAILHSIHINNISDIIINKCTLLNQNIKMHENCDCLRVYETIFCAIIVYVPNINKWLPIQKQITSEHRQSWMKTQTVIDLKNCLFQGCPLLPTQAGQAYIRKVHHHYKGMKVGGRGDFSCVISLSG